MAKLDPSLAAPAAYTDLPVRMVTLGAADEQMAVHVTGQFDGIRPPLLCVPGYHRNMADFSAFVPLQRRLMKTDWPVVLVDLRGRGRSSFRGRADDYSTTNDARDLSTLVRALGIERAIVLGQGHGGQVAMALALERPGLLAAAVLIDAGPMTAPQSLVRLRSNADAIAKVRGDSGATLMLRRMAGADYPGLDNAELDRLAARTHLIDARGRTQPLFDPALIERLRGFTHDDVLAPQWTFFDLLQAAPLLLLRTELTDQLPQPVLDEMLRRRPDALALAITRQGSPALLNRTDEVGAIVEFVRRAVRPVEKAARRA